MFAKFFFNLGKDPKVFSILSIATAIDTVAIPYGLSAPYFAFSKFCSIIMYVFTNTGFPEFASSVS